MRTRVLISMVIALLLLVATAVSAMAVEDSKTASVTVNEYISFTVTDQGAAGINFGNLDPGANDNPESAQTGTDGAVKLTVAAETNCNCDIQTKGSGDFSYLTNNMALNNAKWDKDNAVAGATAMTTTYSTIDSSTAGVAKTVDTWHWLSIPSGQVAGDYQTTFYYQAVKI